jgi:F420H(2)-dependent quinone reductase
MTHTVTDSPDPSVSDHVRRYLATDGRDGFRRGGALTTGVRVEEQQ